MSETIERTYSGFDPFGDIGTQMQPSLFDQAEANRLDTYFEKIKSELTNREFEVLSAVAEINKPCTMHEVAKYMNRDLNTISGRFSKLVEKGKLIITGRTENKRSLYKLNLNN